MKEIDIKDMGGAYAALFTPYDAQGRVNTEAIAAIVEYGLANGLAGFYVTGTTGEWWLLSSDERRLVMETVVRAARGRGKVIVHVGACNTDDSVALARHAAKVGADCISSIAPPLYRSSFEGACFHYRSITAATDLPFVVYSFGSALVPERDVRLFDIPHVVGMKYTGRDYYAVQALKRDLAARGRETLWFAGCDEQLLCGLALDGVFAGGIGTTYNIIPRHFAKICELAAKNDFKAAAKWQDEANKVVRLMIESDNWSYRKAMMKFVGIDCGAYRPPFEPLTSEQESAFFERFAALGVARRDQALSPSPHP